MIIFGWGGGSPKLKGEVAPLQCPNCERAVFFHHVASTSWFRLYFIPLIPYSTKNFLLCPVCTQGEKLNGQQTAAVERMKGTTNGWRSRLIEDGHYAREVDLFWSAVTGNPTVGGSAGTSLPVPPAPTRDEWG